ncbi:hypothetical protein [Streptomyces niveus]|uniref:hypothetical protein n=1 Tax=Streptomyces niveus TaxID=193462 RepID=UPI0036D2C78E
MNAGGTVIADGITVRRMESYTAPQVGDVIVIARSGNGNWIATGRLSTGAPAVGEVVAVRKPAFTSRTATTTLADDPDLTLTVGPGTYLLDCFLAYDGAQAADFKLGWTVPAGTTGSWWPGGADSGMTALASVPRWGALGDVGASTLPVGCQGAGIILACRPVGTVVVTTAGTFALAWAQQTTSTTATIVRGQSYLRMERIA